MVSGSGTGDSGSGAVPVPIRIPDPRREQRERRFQAIERADQRDAILSKLAKRVRGVPRPRLGGSRCARVTVP